MKLLSTLRYGGISGTAASTGNYGGSLRLFFTTLNPADSSPTPAPILWQAAGKGAVDTYNLPSGDVIAMNLNLVADVPGRLYVFGNIQVTTKGGTVYGPPVGQAASTLFVPGQPAVAILKGRSQGPSGSTHFDVGFDLAVPWDGTSADCHGTWWAVWH